MCSKKTNLIICFILNFICTGCNNIQLNKSGISELILYQAQNKLKSLSKDQVKNEFKLDPSMSMDEYEDRIKTIRGYFTGYENHIAIKTNDFILDNKGHIKIKYDNIETEESKCLFKNKKEYLQVNTALNDRSIRVGLEFDDYYLITKYRYSGDWQIMILWKFRF